MSLKCVDYLACILNENVRLDSSLLTRLP